MTTEKSLKLNVSNDEIKLVKDFLYLGSVLVAKILYQKKRDTKGQLMRN